jgi:uncharacterized damage-inducible protein DinB
VTDGQVTGEPLFDGPALGQTDTRALLTEYLDWYRDAIARKLAGLSDTQLREPLAATGWAPLGLVQHLTGVERRWFEWGYRAADVVGFPPGDEWSIADGVSAREILAAWHLQCARSREIVAASALERPAAVGGRFPDAEHAPPLVRILFHVLQEYARHAGQLDIVRELIDGTTGE